jgi:CspA family cold shock protein
MIRACGSIRLRTSFETHIMPTGTVRFFDPAKGFGFIGPNDGQEDIFVHVSAVEQAGLPGLNQGDVLAFDVEKDQRTGKFRATELELLEPAATAAPPRSQREWEPSVPAAKSAGGPDRGVVKWFNQAKGFGFISPDGAGPDVFVHISAVERAGFTSLTEGQAVSYEVAQDRRSGKMSATNLQL